MDILSRKKTQDSGRGFTLIEMLVVVAIMVVVSTVVLANNGRFGGTAVLQNIAYEIALSVRQAQIYGISVRRFTDNSYASAYGMHFSEGANTFELFADVVDADGMYTRTRSGGELVQSTTIRSGYTISKLCTSKENCDGIGVRMLDISFRRPETEAWISANGTACTTACYARACVELKSPRGDIRAVIITVNGQIEVKNTCL